jgi:hypothetical protein
MAYEYCVVGTQRFDRQGFIGSTDPNYCVRLYHVTAVGSASGATVNVACIPPTVGMTTATAGTAYLTLVLTSGTSYIADWDNHYGFLLDSGTALFQTCTGFSYAVIGYQMVKK